MTAINSRPAEPSWAHGKMRTTGRAVPDRGKQRVYVQVTAVRRSSPLARPGPRRVLEQELERYLVPEALPRAPTRQCGRLCPPAAMTARTRRSCDLGMPSLRLRVGQPACYFCAVWVPGTVREWRWRWFDVGHLTDAQVARLNTRFFPDRPPAGWTGLPRIHTPALLRYLRVSPRQTLYRRGGLPVWTKRHNAA